MTAWDSRAVSIGLAVLAATALLVAASWVQRLLLRWRIQARLARAKRGEERAGVLLESRGYQVLERQYQGEWTLTVDGQSRSGALKTDYLVWKDGKRFIAEVKTGRGGTTVESSATRRQLLEYRVAFDVDGVLLVDVEAGDVAVIEFAISASQGGGRSPAIWVFAWLVAVALGVVMGRVL